MYTKRPPFPIGNTIGAAPIDRELSTSLSASDVQLRCELLTRADLRSLGIRASNPTLLVWEADGTFPKRLTISPAKVAWLRHEVIAVD